MTKRLTKQKNVKLDISDLTKFLTYPSPSHFSIPPLTFQELKTQCSFVSHTIIYKRCSLVVFDVKVQNRSFGQFFGPLDSTRPARLFDPLSKNNGRIGQIKLNSYRDLCFLLNVMTIIFAPFASKNLSLIKT